MKRTRIMNRIFSAVENKESEVLDQMQNDIEIAKEDGQLSTEQYTIESTDEGVVITDNDNGEKTLVSGDGPDYSLSVVEEEDPTEVPTSLEDVQQNANINSEVTWRNELGEVQTGILTEVLGDTATVSQDGVSIAMPLANLTPVDVVKEEPESRTYAMKYDDGKIITRIGDYDIEIDVDEGTVLVLDENISFKFDPKAPFGKALADIKKKMRKEGLKGFSNLAKFSSTTQRMFARSVDERKEVLLARLDQLKKQYRELVGKMSRLDLDKKQPNYQQKLRRLEDKQDIVELRIKIAENDLNILELRAKNEKLRDSIKNYN